jgi:glycine/D-amino acid oxidase-like deaminating enzyme
MTATRETFGRSLWSALTPPAPTLPTLAGERRADVAVIGAGILGLSLALHLALAGVQVLLVEAAEPGFGASGRNTGFVVPSFTAALGPSEVIRLLGEAPGERLSRFVGGAATAVFTLVAEQGIDCAAEQTGWLQPAPTEAGRALVERRVAEWQRLGQPVRLLDRAETLRLTGSPQYHAALVDDSGGQINPLAYARGLAEAARRAGAGIVVRSPVRGMSRQAGRWRLDTGSGSVLAETVFATTNALGGRLLPTVRQSLIPVRPYQVATQPLPPAVQARLLPERQPVADLHRHTFAYRWSPDGRLVTGGLALLNTPGATERAARTFLRRLGRYLPDLPPLEPAFSWNGVVATTPDFLPAIWEVGPGLYAPIGCNGRGIAVTTALGQALARFTATGDRTALPLAITPPRPRPFQPLMAYGPSLWLARNQWLDARDDRRAG